MKRIQQVFFKHVSGERDKQVIKNMFGAFAIKGGAIVIALFTMPAYIRYFDNQMVLGLWFTVLSVMMWILSFDFGIGNGLRNKLVEAIVRGDKHEIKAFISSAYVIIAGIVAIAIFFGFTISNFVDWNQVFNISKNIVSESTMLFTVRCVFISMMLQFLLSLIYSILYSMQKSAITNLIVLIISVTQLIFVLLAPKYDLETNLKMLSIAYGVCINVPLIVASIIVFETELKSCAPNIKFFNKNKAISVLSTGGVFFWNQIMFMIIVTTNEFFITQFSGPKYVVEYQIYYKLFTLVGSLFMVALSPIWSAITKALNERDAAWIDKTYKRINHMVIVAVGCEFIIIPFLQFVINIWLGESAITVNYIFAMFFALYGSVFIYQCALSTIVCGMGKMKFQAISYTVAVVLKFVIIYFGMKLYNSWIVVIFANSLILIPYCLMQPKYIRRHINNLKFGGI
ncbi:hypothetical protein LGL55_11570 [Clostridium tagluense]|uniref:lipopolysaccharide biosynthesis protein n=1 Tax=Clostridium tagluense TaxID=360422 RepID=UPI001CF4AA98|nr:hypothetical protein [Clostridium tagluense]MCB2312029.1 hypothetical protein [Clostridium tagluense]MCB2316616.1 hypothetical protein [Clostridium tagluense]MCB2321448.1 hypothetical protein [Clostridium tagluense]MCB2326460.1 hypothetical protein [Clostridium tagluense]MCB2331208.1 hypothetical protein [Clostridium tagluense]